MRRIGGHSVSAKMTSVADARKSLPAEAVISLGFPRKGDASRTAHLNDTTLPVLFIQGTKDSLGTVDEINDMAATLGDKATVKWIEGASHGFKVDDREDGDVVIEVAQHIRDYTGV